VWAVTELPLVHPPATFTQVIERGEPLLVFEEHCRQGGFGMQLLYELTALGLSLRRFVHRYALGYPSGRYGSQAFHRKECGLDADAIRAVASQ
jgi:transketolase